MANNNIHASDTWAFYQAKSIRQTSLRVAADSLDADLRANPNMPPDARDFVQQKIEEYRATAARYEDEPDREDPGNPLKGEGRKQLTARAKDFEAQRDQAQKQDPNFDFSEALFQIAIVLASVAILADSRLVLRLSLVVGALARLGYLLGCFHLRWGLRLLRFYFFGGMLGLISTRLGRLRSSWRRRSTTTRAMSSG